ncbi:hypothetical protein F2P81_008366 [Scophthalmus maximus]|uniref:Uncharacterized protein n=1 Tax=Scophthalmus maximus TaxID=52904 RepID=A0A6A4TB29_SCOMX|nr:hypothetical protein F2P81_008366 [Scophthalmus maximus]
MVVGVASQSGSSVRRGVTFSSNVNIFCFSSQKTRRLEDAVALQLRESPVGSSLAKVTRFGILKSGFTRPEFLKSSTYDWMCTSCPLIL